MLLLIILQKDTPGKPEDIDIMVPLLGNRLFVSDLLHVYVLVGLMHKEHI